MREEGGTMSRQPELREQQVPTVIKELTKDCEMQHNGVPVNRTTNLKRRNVSRLKKV